jgi:flagellar basal-body rod modification protein FlgD
MDIGAVAATQANATAKAQKSLSGNYETFLRLLTTQLQNQDPLEPLDATKFTEQLVSYSQVEQQIATNSSLNTLISVTRSSAGATAVSFLGKNAITAGQVSNLSDGNASWQYTLPQDATGLQVRVTDMNGNVVKTLTGEAKVGTHQINWDGMNTSGSPMPAGSYKLTVAATKADGSAIPVKVSGIGMISEIDMSGAEPVLYVGSRKLSLSEITGFKN